MSALSELANIMAASCMKAIGDYSKIRIFLSPVMIGVDMAGALISFPIAQTELKCEKAVSIDTSFALTNSDGDVVQNVGRVIIMPDEKSVVSLMDALGI